MKMVAAATLRKAQNRLVDTRPYAEKIKDVVARLVYSTEEDNVLLRQPDEVENVLVIVISSDRGLCGAFNNNLFKVVEQKISEDLNEYYENDRLSLVTIGRKACNHFGKRGYNVIQKFDGFFDDLQYNKTCDIMNKAIKDFLAGKYDQVYLAYNEFKSVLTQNRIFKSVLPIDPVQLVQDGDTDEEHIDYIFEPNIDAILDDLLPLHLNMQLWRAVLESNAAEQGARMTAMDNATENAKELERDLRLEYNQARQSAITTEISEIVSGAQALSES